MDDVFLPPDSQQLLLSLSRHALNDFVRGVTRQTEAVNDPNLQTRDYGAFVSLHKKQELRGCIGNCVSKDPLYRTVIEMTRAAASRDTRMAPVSEDELDDIRIDITVLSPLVKAGDPLSLKVGKHGLHVSQGGRRGVLLPQVAVQYQWDMKTFLEQTCIKAGLRKDAWRNESVEVSTFTALVMEEQR